MYLNHENKIQAIKALREFTQKEFGGTLGLLESKHAVESIFDHAIEQTEKEFIAAAKTLMCAGRTPGHFEDYLKSAGVHPNENLWL